MAIRIPGRQPGDPWIIAGPPTTPLMNARAGVLAREIAENYPDVHPDDWTEEMARESAGSFDLDDSPAMLARLVAEDPTILTIDLTPDYDDDRIGHVDALGEVHLSALDAVWHAVLCRLLDRLGIVILPREGRS